MISPNKIRTVLFLSTLIVLTSCPYGHKYELGTLPTTPVNLEDFNSEYDDYNSTSPISGSLVPFCFSSNRNTLGNEFDVLFMPMNIRWDKSTGVLTVTNDIVGWEELFKDHYSGLNKGVSLINTNGNELGPYVLSDRSGLGRYYNNIVFYASDNESHNFDIFYTYDTADQAYKTPIPLSSLNGEFNDLYPSVDQEHTALYFCSDRGGAGFDIYMTAMDTVGNGGITGVLDNDLFGEIVKVEEISTTHEDKCPYVFRNIMVFTSDRPGGYGGLDLYYSLYENGKWGAPVNFGEEINSSSDEYRPIVFDEQVTHKQAMMVFSSNRPGGAGGYDLYFVGIDQAVEY